MKILTAIFLIGSGAMRALGQAPAQEEAATNAVVVSTALIDRLMEEARTNNPALKAADARVNAATLNEGAVRAWDDPTATFGGSVFSASGFDPKQQGDLVYGVEEKLPLWGRPKLNRDVAQAETATRRAETNYRRNQLRRDLTKELLTTAFAQRAVEIGEQDLAWLDVTAKATENKYRAGQAALADTLQIQNETAERNDELRTDRLRLGHEQLSLNRLLNRDASSSWPLLRLPATGPAIPFSAKLLALALASEPSLKVFEQQIRQAEASAALVSKSHLPDVSLGVEGRQFSGDGGFREGDFTVRFSLPWFNGDKYHKDYEREKQKQISAEQDREDQLLTVREELHHLCVDLEATRREALLYGGEISTRAAQALSSRLTDWENGKGAFRDVLDARRMLLDSELTAARAIRQENEVLADLLLWTGLDQLETLVPLANEPSLLLNHDHSGDPHE